MNIKDKKLYYIGGVVRDELLNKKSFDIDLTYDGDAIEFAKTIKDAEILQINEQFGTVRIRLDGEEIDIASTRCESYPQKGHLPVVNKIGCSLKDDVMRRDFTINAMAKSTLTGEIVDYTGGLKDIKNKTLRVLHNQSFIDDPTRIVRALKFAVRFGFELDDKTKKLQQDYINNINYDMSYKRLKKELMETFNLNSSYAFERFIKQRIYKLISPKEFSYIDVKEMELLINKYKISNPWVLYVGLLPDISSLPLTKSEKKIVDEYKKIVITHKANDYEIYKTFKDIPIESVIMYSIKQPAIVNKYLENLKDIKLEITGNDLKNLGIEPSEKYNQCFEYIIEEKIKYPATFNKLREIEFAKKFFNFV